LKEILTTMSARVVEEASPVVPLDGKGRTAADIVTDATLSAAVSAALAVLVRAAARRNNFTTTAHS
jgi:hypothetical protein